MSWLIFNLLFLIPSWVLCMMQLHLLTRLGTCLTVRNGLQVNQLLVGVHSTAACEAMLLAEKLGIQDQQALQDVLTTSFGCSEVLKRHMPIITARYSSQLVGTCVVIRWPSTSDRLLAAGHILSYTSCQLRFHGSHISSFKASWPAWICPSSDSPPVAVDNL